MVIKSSGGKIMQLQKQRWVTHDITTIKKNRLSFGNFSKPQLWKYGILDNLRVQQKLGKCPLIFFFLFLQLSLHSAWFGHL